MSHQNTVRLLLAFFLSSMVFLSTWFWYIRGIPPKVASDQDSVGYISEQTNDVQKRSTTKVLWENTTNGESLYPGEAIRTSAESEAKFFLFDSNTELRLLPDSLIVLEKNAKGLELNFLSGELFVNSGTSKPNAQYADVTIKAGANTIDPKKSSLSLSKTETGEINVDVHRGNVTLIGRKQTVSVVPKKPVQLRSDGDVTESKMIRVISPVLGDQILIDRGQKGITVFFEPLPSTEKVYIEFGTDAKKMSGLPNAFVSGASGKINLPIKLGRVYWRLRSEGPNSSKNNSIVINNLVGLLRTPVLMQPSFAEVISPKKWPHALRFLWSSSSPLKDGVLEVSKENNFSDIFYRRTFASGVEFLDVSIKEPGNFYWRVSGRIEQQSTERTITSRVGQFSLTLVAPTATVPPPVTEATSSLDWLNADPEEIKQTVTLPLSVDLQWKPLNTKISLIYKYSVEQVENARSEKFETKTNRAKFFAKAFGLYRVSLEARDPSGKLIATAPIKSVKVIEKPTLEAPIFSQSIPAEITSSTDGSVQLSWLPVDGAVEYEWQLKSKVNNKVVSRKVSRTVASIGNLRPGQFEVSVRAIDEGKRPGQRSVPKLINVPAESSIKAPQIKKVEIN